MSETPPEYEAKGYRAQHAETGSRYKLLGKGDLTVRTPEWTAVLTRGLVYKASATLPNGEPDLDASPPLVPVRIVAAHAGEFQLVEDKAPAKAKKGAKRSTK